MLVGGGHVTGNSGGCAPGVRGPSPLPLASESVSEVEEESSEDGRDTGLEAPVLAINSSPSESDTEEEEEDSGGGIPRRLRTALCGWRGWLDPDVEGLTGLLTGPCCDIPSPAASGGTGESALASSLPSRGTPSPLLAWAVKWFLRPAAEGKDSGHSLHRWPY